MKEITFNVDAVLPALLQVSSVVAPKSSMPILSDVIIKSFANSSEDKTDVMLSTSDGEQWLSMRGELVSGDSEFEVAVNAQDLLKVLKNLNGRIVTLSLKENSTTLKGTYGNGEFSIPFDNAADFPKPIIGDGERHEEIVDASTLLNAIAYTEFAAVNNIVRPVMSGIHFDFFKDCMVSVALNNMTFAKRTDMTVEHDEDVTKSLTIPNSTVHVMERLLLKTQGDVKLSFSENNMVLSRSDFRLTARLLEGKYPPYNKLLRNETPIVATVSREDAMNALKRVMPMGNATSECCRFTFAEGLMTVSAEDLDYSKSASENVKCDYQGEEFNVALKGSSVMSALSNITDDNVVIKMTDATKMVWFTPETQEENTEYIILIMPMLLSV